MYPVGLGWVVLRNCFIVAAQMFLFFFLDEKEPKNQGCIEMTKILIGLPKI